MKKFIIAAGIIVVAIFTWNMAYYHLGIYIGKDRSDQVETSVTCDSEGIYMYENGEKVPFEIRGVNMGVGLPGKWATDYAIDKETYLRWFRYVQDMGANTIRVYTILHSQFYEAFYEYNKDNPDPLYLIHGVWINDYVQNSHRDAYDSDFIGTFEEDCRTVVDIVHGKKSLLLGYGTGAGRYRNDISQWVIGYILGVEWEDVTVVYTDNKYPERNSYKGRYMYTSEDATPFEAMLCRVGDRIIEYESSRYGEQRLVAFSNWPTTDPFDYPYDIERYFMKCAKVDVEHIKITDEFKAGQFVSYHVYPYYPDYLGYYEDKTGFEKTEDGGYNTYKEYLKRLTEHHEMPVVISEFGVSAARGMAQKDRFTGRNQGNMSEDEQGQALVECYEDIMDAGCVGSIVFTWQDEWFKRTWNTMHAVDLQHTPFWSDWQTNEQYFGLLAFDPGEEESICYVDGDTSEWKKENVISENGDVELSMMYDEKFLYFRVKKDDFDPEKDTIYIPLDITPKSGSNWCRNEDVSFDRQADFLIVIKGKDESRILVQERYSTMRAMYRHETEDKDAYTDPPDIDTPEFTKINLMLQTATPLITGKWNASAEVYETGKLLHANGNPEDEDFNSLADFHFTEDGLELRIPWQLVNFSNPSDMKIHDDYYEHYGVEEIEIDELYAGAASGDMEGRIRTGSLALEGWGEDVTYHERLKESYYIMKEYWTSTEDDDPSVKK